MTEDSTGEALTTVRFANVTVRLALHGTRAVRIGRFLFRHATRSRHPPDVTVRLTEGETGSAVQFQVDVDRAVCFRGTSDAMAAIALLDEVAHQIADRSRSGLVLHGGAVAGPDGAVLLPGASGAGKTTLTAWLIAHGWRYLTDELAFVATGLAVVHGLARPLHLKQLAIPAVRAFADLDARADADDTLETPSSLLVQPSRLSGDTPAGPTRIDRLVFPRYQPGADDALTRLSPAEAGLRLMACLINARNLDGDGFPAATRLARQCPAYELRYGHFSQLNAWRRPKRPFARA